MSMSHAGGAATVREAPASAADPGNWAAVASGRALVAATRREGSAGETAGLKGHPRSFWCKCFVIWQKRLVGERPSCRDVGRISRVLVVTWLGRTGEELGKMIGLVSDTC